jgi:hypothetical protein
MNNNELKLHTPVKIEIDDWCGPRTIIAAAYEVYHGNSMKYRIVDVNGQLDRIDSNDIMSITDCGLSEKSKNIIINLSELYAKEITEENKFREFKQNLLRDIQLTTFELKNTTGLISKDEFEDELNDLLARKIGCDTWARLSHAVEDTEHVVISIEKLAVRNVTPEKCRFLRKEHDKTLWLDTDSEEYRNFVIRNAPTQNEVLEKLTHESCVGVTLNLGDKNSLSVHRDYKVKLPYGCTRKQLNELEKML